MANGQVPRTMALLAFAALSGPACSPGQPVRDCAAGEAPAIVVDATTKQPVCAAVVSASRVGGGSTVTIGATAVPSDAGSCVYYLINAPPGTYDLSASSAGYKTGGVPGFVETPSTCPLPPPQTVTIQLTPG
jgi:hypothetical protein